MLKPNNNRFWLAFFFVIQQVSFLWLANNAPEPDVYNNNNNGLRRRNSPTIGTLPDGTQAIRSFLPRWQLRVPEAVVQQMDQRAVVSMNRIEHSLDELQQLQHQQHRLLQLVLGNNNDATTTTTTSTDQHSTNSGAGVVVAEDDFGRLAVVVAVKSGTDTERLLRITLSELVEQMIQLDLYGEFFIIINNGRKQPDDTDRLRMMLETQVPGLDRVVMGRTVRVPDRSPSVADEVVLPTDTLSSLSSAVVPRRIQAILIEQYHDQIKNSGKIRALRDMYQYLYREAVTGRYRPELLFNIDAETRLRRRLFEMRDGPLETWRKLTDRDHWRRCTEQQFRHNVPDGLGSLIEKARQGYVVGAAMKMIAFDESGQPIFDELAIAPVSHLGDINHALFKSSMYLMGGALMAPYLVGLPMYRELSTWPGNVGEDNTITFTTRLLGLPAIVLRDVVLLNRAPLVAKTGLAVSNAQIERWVGSLERYQLVFYRQLVLECIDARFIYSLGRGVKRFLLGYDHALLLYLVYYIRDWAGIIMQEYFGPPASADEIFFGDGAW